MSFEKEIEKGNFVVGQCTKCNETVWPPSEFCSKCFGDVTVRKANTEGRIIEFSRQGEDYFCLAEFEGNVRIIGKIISEIPQDSQKVKVEKCGLRDGSYFFEFSLV